MKKEGSDGSDITASYHFLLQASRTEIQRGHGDGQLINVRSVLCRLKKLLGYRFPLSTTKIERETPTNGWFIKRKRNKH
jgi:hypothetical protein